MIQLGNAYIPTNHEKADSIFYKSLKIAEAVGDSSMIALSKYRLGWNRLKQNEFNQAIPYVLEAIKYKSAEASKVDRSFAAYHMTAGWLYEKVGQYFMALDFYSVAQEEFQKSKRTRDVANVLVNIGIVHNRLDDRASALDYYSKAKLAYETVADTIGLVYSFNNIGYMSQLNGAYDEAIRNYNKGIELSERISFKDMLPTLYQNIGQTYVSDSKYALAKKAYNKSIETNQVFNDIRSDLYAQIELENLKYLVSEQPADLSILRKAYNKGVALGDIELQKRAAELLYLNNKRSHKYQQALRYKEVLNNIKDSLANEEVKVKVSNLEMEKRYSEQSFKNELDRQKLESDYKSVIQGQSHFRNILLVGLGFTLLFSSLLYRNNKKLLGIKQDLESKNVALVEAESTLAKKNLDLEKYIELNIELEQFANIVSHDIKSPLRTISSYIGLLKKKINDKLSPQEEEQFSIIENNSKRLNDLVDDLLIYTKANADNLKVSRFNLQDLTEEVLEDIKYYLQNSNAKIEFEAIDKVIEADKVKVKLILQNLIDNAVKFSQSKAHPFVLIQCNETDKNYCISVSDNGIGIPSDFKDSIYEKFVQLNRKDAYEGTGLGLSIVKNYVEKHQGDITVSEGIDGGAKFSFTIQKNLFSNA